MMAIASSAPLRRPSDGGRPRTKRVTGRIGPALCILLLLASGALPAAMPRAVDQASIERRLAALAPAANPAALEHAARVLACRPSGVPDGDTILTVIDFSLPSSVKRLWVFDLRHERLLFEEWVAHGRNSGGLRAEAFSNRPGSLMSSVGTFRTGTTYDGRNGYSLQLDGLDVGLNDKARERAIVMHGADYVSEDFLQAQGRLGRSFGCPAVRRQVARDLIDTIKGGTLVYAYAPLDTGAGADPRPCSDTR
jgi:hypothetical protein